MTTHELNCLSILANDKYRAACNDLFRCKVRTYNARKKADRFACEAIGASQVKTRKARKQARACAINAHNIAHAQWENARQAQDRQASVARNLGNKYHAAFKCWNDANQNDREAFRLTRKA